MNVKRIMFVCHGNICRSPMAEFVFKDMSLKSGRADEFVVASAGTSSEEIRNGVGNPVYPPAKAELKKNGISCDGKRAVLLRKDDYEKYDVFLCMDHYNLRNVLRIFGSDPAGKVRMFLPDRDVSDPWYTGNFSETYKDIAEGCRRILLQSDNKVI